MRLDLVLQPELSALDLATIIVEFQHTIDQLFLKRIVNYCLQAFKRYKINPAILAACVDTLHTDAAHHTTASRFSGGYVFPSYRGAADCTVISKKKKALKAILIYLRTHSMPLDCFSPTVLSQSQMVFLLMTENTLNIDLRYP